MNKSSKRTNVFSSNLLYYLNKKEVMQKDLAQYLGVSPGSVNDWVKNRHCPRIDKLYAMTDYFGVSVSDLLEEKTTNDDNRFIELFNSLSMENRELVINLMKSLK